MDGKIRFGMAVSIDTGTEKTLETLFNIKSAFYVASDFTIARIKKI
jgi:hypothetical protein